MSAHITDDQLILHFYGETPREAAAIDAHLASCDDCRKNWTTLQQTLRMVDSADVAEAPAGFERVMWARVQPSLPAPKATRAAWWSPRLWAPAAGLLAVVALAFMTGRLWPAAPANPAIGARDAAADARTQREGVLLSALGDHFEQTEQLLVEIKNSPDAKKIDLSYEQQTARDLVAASRLYKVTAEQNGDGQLAAVLEDLERVLVDVAAGPEHMTAKDLTALRERIEDDSLIFKVRALTVAVREREKALTTAPTGAKRTL